MMVLDCFEEVTEALSEYKFELRFSHGYFIVFSLGAAAITLLRIFPN